MAQTSVVGTKLIVVAFFGGKLNRHVHIDVGLPEAFPKSIRKKAKTSLDQIRATISELSGSELNVELSVEYSVLQNELPDIARASMIESRVGKTSLKVVGGIVKVDGAPIEAIFWFVHENCAAINLRATAKLVISDSYIKEAFGLVNTAFDVLSPPRP